MIGISLKLTKDLARWAEKKRKQTRRALTKSLYSTSVRLMKDLRDDVKTGKLRLKKLSYRTKAPAPAKRLTGRQRKRARIKRNPLIGLWRGVTFNVDRRLLRAEVGFRGVGGTAWQKRLAEKSADGYVWRYSERKREALHKAGIHLRKTTSSARVPARDIIEAVRVKRGREAYDRWQRIFFKEMAKADKR